jgi:hypothetical protein
VTIQVVPAEPKLFAPSVGIFWLVDGVLVIDRSTLDKSEPYGDCLTHPGGHYERWETWRELGIGGLRAIGFPDCMQTSEYDEWPRGRIVYETVERRFVLYADRRLQSPGIVDALKTAFCLHEANVIVMSDAHYR